MNKELTYDELLHAKGQEAEQFMRSLHEGERYFLNLLESIKKDIEDQINGLNPLQTSEFTILKAKLDCLYEPIKKVLADIEIGKIAWNRINGTVEQGKGIL